MIIFKFALVIAAFLFFVNWVCLMATQKYKGLPWGDFLLIFVLALFIFKYADVIKERSRIFPDTLNALALEPREKLSDVKNGLRETRETAAALLQYFKMLVQEDLEKRMRYHTEP